MGRRYESFISFTFVNNFRTVSQKRLILLKNGLAVITEAGKPPNESLKRKNWDISFQAWAEKHLNP